MSASHWLASSRRLLSPPLHLLVNFISLKLATLRQPVQGVSTVLAASRTVWCFVGELVRACCWENRFCLRRLRRFASSPSAPLSPLFWPSFLA